MNIQPGLFGIDKSNRDFSKAENWGKNQFNTSFPASLLAYMHSLRLEPVYISLDADLRTTHGRISATELLGIEPTSEHIYHAFERDFSPYQKFVVGNLPRVDYVTMNNNSGECLRGLEIKLTALPDDSTHKFAEDSYGSELVVRPDTIVYLGISIASRYEKNPAELFDSLSPACDEIEDWTNIPDVLPKIPLMLGTFDAVLSRTIERQQPLIVQPIWKTEGKAPVLSQHCLDVFVWSDYAFTRLFVDSAKTTFARGRINRATRTLVWLVKMLYDYARSGKINHKEIIDSQSYNMKNDKAFSLTGEKIVKYMKSPELAKPRVAKNAIRNIILGGGHRLLSPERRFDAVIASTPGLFD